MMHANRHAARGIMHFYVNRKWEKSLVLSLRLWMSPTLLPT